MRSLFKVTLSLLLITALLVAAGCSGRSTNQSTAPKPDQTPASTPSPAQSPATTPAQNPAQPQTPAQYQAPAGPTAEAVQALPGSAEQLKAALAEKSSVKFEIRLVKDTGVKSVSDAFEAELAQVGNPGADTLLLFIYPSANHDIRFAMGGNFARQKFTVDEMLGLVRTHYLPEARKQNPAGGLAELIRRINQRMGQ